MKKHLTVAVSLVLVVIALAATIIVLKRNDTTTASRGVYVALGDSVAAGLGLPSVENATTADKQCGRSSDAYPEFLASTLNYDLHTYACSGAVTADLAPGSPQLQNAFLNRVPKLITITVGANDTHWAELIKSCFTGDCTSPKIAALAASYLSAMQAGLSSDLSGIASLSQGSPPQTIVTGYYSIVSKKCNSNSGLITAKELAWVEQETAALNTAIKAATMDYPFVTYVPLDFSNHDFCSETPWIQVITSGAPFHPTVAGQSVIANTIAQALKAQ